MDTGRRFLLLSGTAAAMGLHGFARRALADEADRISAAARAGGRTVEIAGAVGLRQPLRVASGTRLIGTEGAVLYAEGPLRALIEVEENAAEVSIGGIRLDGRGISDHLVLGHGNEDVELTDCSGINWRFGVVFRSTKDRPARNLRFSRLELSDPSEGAVYPFLVASGIGGPLVDGLVATDITVHGSGGAYSRENSATADQVTLQGVRNFRLARVQSMAGGENGITVSRLSGDGILEHVVASRCDGQGFSIGSGYLAVDVEGACLAPGSRFRAEGGAEGEIQECRDGRMFLNRTVRGTPVPGETIESNGARAVVRNVVRTERIALVDCAATDNWVDVASAKGKGTGFLVQQADAIGLYCCVSRNLGTGAQEYGLIAAHSRLGWAGCDFSGNLTDATVLAGGSEKIPVGPGTPLWSFVQRQGVEVGCVDS